ncbi:MAG: sugar ABC transporter permease [Deltaproteobacteria bacterium]|nr:MAG: sugar ABC transporter permease [Deltaproteobacteria bacterium]
MSKKADPKKVRYEVQWERFGYAMISPSMIFLILVATLPLVSLLIMSFFRIDLTYPLDNGWVGFENYLEMAKDERFWYSIKLTAIYTISTVFLQVAVGLALAMAFFRGFRGQGVMRVSVLLPMILAPVVVGLAWRTLILTPEYGILDYVSILLGFGSKPWLVAPTWAMISVIIIHTWQWTPFAFLVFLASLNAMPQEPLEAALLDTRSAWQRFRYIILPMLQPAIIIVVIFRTMIALRAFAAIFSATGGGPGTATEILNLYAYRVSFNSLDLGYGAALGTVLLLITVGISLFFFRMRRSSTG